MFTTEPLHTTLGEVQGVATLPIPTALAVNSY